MSEPPAPPSRDALAAILARAADAEPLLADRPVEPDDWGVQRIDLACGWSLWVWWSPGQQMGPLHAAQAPDGARWGYGCDRWPDWLAGPDAVVLDPIHHLLNHVQRDQLRQRLLTCSCWPAPVIETRPAPSMEEIYGDLPSWELMPS